MSADTGDPKLPALQSGVRGYRLSGDTLAMSVLLGLRNDASGEIHLDVAGTSSERRFELLGPVLRIFEGESSHLEFERVE